MYTFYYICNTRICWKKGVLGQEKDRIFIIFFVEWLWSFEAMAGEEDKSCDYYAVLELKKECTSAELRHAYKKLALVRITAFDIWLFVVFVYKEIKLEMIVNFCVSKVVGSCFELVLFSWDKNVIFTSLRIVVALEVLFMKIKITHRHSDKLENIINFLCMIVGIGFKPGVFILR